MTSRFNRTPSRAKQAVETGKVDVAGQRPKSSRAVRVGEALQISRGDEVFDIQVLGLSEMRGPAPVAQQLYAESEATREAGGVRRRRGAAGKNGEEAPEDKPDQRGRGLLRALGDRDAL